MFKKLLPLIVAALLIPSSVLAVSVLIPPQGGTGIGSVTSQDIGKVLIVSSTSPFQYKLGDAGGKLSGTGTPQYFPYWTNSTTLSSTSTAYFNDFMTDLGCHRWSTSTPGAWASACLQDVSTMTIPFNNLLLNSTFDSWNATDTLPNNWTSFSSPLDGGSDDGSYVQSKNTTGCNGGGNCVQQIITSDSDGVPYGAFLEQEVAYDPTKAYTGHFEFKRTNNNSSTLDYSCALVTNFDFQQALFSSPPAWGKFWSFVSSSWFDDFSFVIPDGLRCSGNPTSAWQTVNIPTITGNNATSSVFFNEFNSVSGNSVTETVLTDNVVFGIATSTAMTGRNGFIVTSPKPIFLEGDDVHVQKDLYVTSTVHATDVVVSSTLSTDQLTVRNDVTAGYVLGALDGTGLIGYFPPDILGPWMPSPIASGYVLKDLKSACVGITGTVCDFFTPGALVAEDGIVINKLALGSADAFNQNQQLTLVGPHGNGDGSILAYSASTPTTTTGEDIGINGAGGYMTWFAKKLAFRAGYVSDNRWNADNIGTSSVALGNDSNASGENSTGLSGGNAVGKNSTAIGMGASGLGTNDISLSFNGTFSIASSTLGCLALNGQCYGNNSLALLGSRVNGAGSVGIGSGITIDGNSSFGIDLGQNASNTFRIIDSNVLAIAGGKIVFGSTSTANSILTINDNNPFTDALAVGGFSNFYATSTFNDDIIQTSGVAQAGQAMCYLTDGSFGHCTSIIGVSGACTCAKN